MCLIIGKDSEEGFFIYSLYSPEQIYFLRQAPVVGVRPHCIHTRRICSQPLNSYPHRVTGHKGHTAPQLSLLLNYY